MRKVIKEWLGPGGKQSVDYIDTDNIWDIVKWCREYFRNPIENDTTDPLVRWNIGVYQLGYALQLLRIENVQVPKTELYESVASALIHMICVAEYITNDIKYEEIDSILDSEEKLSSLENRLLLLGCLFEICMVTRQIVYFKLNRKNRFNKELLKQEFYNLFKKLYMFISDREDMSQAYEDAMVKLQVSEFKGH